MANPPLLVSGAAFAAWSVVMDPGAGMIPGLAFAVFGVLERVNYFYTQLTYATCEDLHHLRSKGFRRSHLARDLERRSVRARTEGRPSPHPRRMA
ncbi:hypothetical protein ACSNOI_37660 [Actinomadura kijaniata]|uniref:hypothetical protein n=1 Tax=Actinomadura kijaniata TaxID=46161 RepID=UPI003F1D65EF